MYSDIRRKEKLKDLSINDRYRANYTKETCDILLRYVDAVTD
jgi:hypothetical protein